MSKKLSKILALGAACAVVMSCMCSCAAQDDYNDSSPRGDYRKDEHSNNNKIDPTYSYEPEYDTAEDEYGIDSSVYPSSNEDYKQYIEAGFKDPNAEPLSTFSVDVDTASYSNVRRLLEDGNFVPEDAVRAEEFINYFDYDYPDPEEGRVFGDYVEVADCPWNPANKLMMIGIQGKRLESKEVPPSNLVFLIDSSGSMSSRDKLPLVQTAFSMLAENLTANDRISIVTYAGHSDTILEGASGKDKDEILNALYSITASGGTNGEGGIEKAYALAEKYFIDGGNNRVILATDGDLNIGASSEDELVKLIKAKRDKGIYLSVLGFGTGNYKDNKMEAIADNGNGNYSYIDSVDEAHRVLVQEMEGTLYTIAKDVKIQVEFNPAQVKSYRLIGYDNRLMEAEDFYDDSKDAGEVGAGHSVTALYEVELTGDSADGTYHGVELEFADEHKDAAAESKPANDDSRKELIKFSVAYKDIDTDEEVYSSNLYGMERYSENPTHGIQLAGAVAEFGMLLKDSQYKGDSSFDYIIKTANSIGGSNEKIAELAELAETVSKWLT